MRAGDYTQSTVNWSFTNLQEVSFYSVKYLDRPAVGVLGRADTRQASVLEGPSTFDNTVVPDILNRTGRRLPRSYLSHVKRDQDFLHTGSSGSAPPKEPRSPTARVVSCQEDHSVRGKSVTLQETKHFPTATSVTTKELQMHCCTFLPVEIHPKTL